MWSDTLLVQTVKKFIAKHNLTLGAALAYYTAFSLGPLLLLTLSIAAVVFGEQAASGRLTADLEMAVGPAVAEAIEQTLQAARASGHNSTATLIGLGALFFAAGGIFGQLQGALNLIWEVDRPKEGGLVRWLRSRFLSYLMVLGTGFLLLVSLVVSAAISWLANHFLPGEAVLSRVLYMAASFGVVTLLFALIFKVLPDCDVAWRDVWVGSVVTAALFTLGKYLLGLYLAQASIGSAYGAAGSLAVILVWVYYASQILLFGAQFTQVYAEKRRTTDKGQTA